MTPKPTNFYIATRDWGQLGWGNIGDMTDSRDKLHDLITEAFRDDTLPADLTTVQVWHFTADCPVRDVTEDVLTEIGAYLSGCSTAEDYPDAFLDWANTDIQDALAEAALATWADEQNALNRSAA